MVKKILVPTDGTGYGETAIDYGVYMAKKFGASLEGIHVIDVRMIQGPVVTDITGSIGVPPCQEFYPLIEKGLEERAEAVLAAFRRRCEERGVTPSARKAYGVIDETIIEAGREADWIILARRGEHFHLAKGAILGSTAEAVVRKAGKPVMVTPRDFVEIESMALAYDGSPPAKNALRLAAFLSEKAAWPLTTLIVTADQKHAALLTKQIEEYLDPFHVDSEVVVMAGKEEREIVRFLKEGAVELLVMGAYGNNRLRELLLGSTTSYVIRNSPRPVFLTR
ncbi:MAG TPA: universal stress protein [Syntrophales bacterium]|nr:universal stress protein [Syntrophales bacterium]HOM07040.1 universal stress protein [Syntrophales bacterium]HON99561.1 universal stress protein [Syntrophales bacterium]HPC01053.1 universal stress protein [Syntrophales bacterium]HPQ06808.1 universal stress protein [Syntrophales bacterium]